MPCLRFTPAVMARWAWCLRRIRREQSQGCQHGAVSCSVLGVDGRSYRASYNTVERFRNYLSAAVFSGPRLHIIGRTPTLNTRKFTYNTRFPRRNYRRSPESHSTFYTFVGGFQKVIKCSRAPSNNPPVCWTRRWRPLGVVGRP